MDPTTLQTVWFLLICILWIGYFVLEGYDFGVGMLLRVVGREPVERRMVIHSIGPYWDGNEVWLLVAGGATFAAFPEWYATLFSGFYLALFLILIALILRNVAFEFWGKEDGPRWRATWEWCIVGGSALPALLWGVGWANIVAGTPIGRDGEFTGTLFSLLTPYALLGGVTSLLLFLTHGAIFLSLRTTGDVEARARTAARRAAPAAVAAVVAFMVWTLLRQAGDGGVEWVSAALAVLAVALAVAVPPVVRSRPLAAFGLTCGVIATLFSALFAELFPNALVSSTSHAFDLTLRAASSTQYTLTVMTVVAVLLVPLVLLYQGWTYWVFRARLSREDYETMHPPLERRKPEVVDT